MTEEEYYAELAKKDETITNMSKQIFDLTMEVAKLKQNEIEQNLYISKLEGKLTEHGAW